MKYILAAAIFFVSIFTLSSLSFALCVNVSDANLRKGPGTNYEKTWEVFKFMPFKKISAKGNWYKVKDLDGDRHWIFKKLVTGKFECGVVKREKINVRTGPGTKYSLSGLSPALKYDSFRILERKSTWVRVQDEFGDKGWIFRKLLWIQ